MYKYRKRKNKKNKFIALVFVLLFLGQIVLFYHIEDSFIYSKFDNISSSFKNKFVQNDNNTKYANAAEKRPNEIIKNPPEKIEDYSSYEQFIVLENSSVLRSFTSLNEAYDFAREIKESIIIDRKDEKLVYSNFDRSILWNNDTKAGDLFLVNKWNNITSEYTLEEFVNLTAKRSKSINPRLENMLLDSKAYLDLSKLAEDVYADGIHNMLITSTYRPYVTQSHLFEARVQRLMDQQYDREEAIDIAAKVVAKPGTSEHQTGLAVDITTIDKNGNIHPLTGSFVNTNVGAWLKDNSWKYGFVIRYQEEKTNITGIIYEPWHLRYVGMPHAEIMYKLNYCLEEYLEYLAKEQHINYSAYNGIKYSIVYFDSISSPDLISTLKQKENIVSLSSDGKAGVILTLLNK